MEKLSRSLFNGKYKKCLTEKVLVFGEGAFLRCFACFAFNELNKADLFNGSLCVVQPIPDGKINTLKEQDGLYTVIARGMKNNIQTTQTDLITCVEDYINPYTDYEKYIEKSHNPDLRFIVSNTTEAGISYHDGDKLNDKPQISFPGKVTAFLYERFKFFNGDNDRGLIFLPCELIDDNGDKLKELVLKYANDWKLENGFTDWVEKSCVFTSTLVDRIAAGYPANDADEADKICNELDYRDELLDMCELFFFWAIQAPPSVGEELQFEKAGLNVVFSEDITPYRLRKVRLLNGSHTCLAPAALLYGLSTVEETVKNETFKHYLEKALFSEIIPTLDLDKNMLEDYANSILERFSNPFIKHALHGITLNCVSKFKARVLPTMLEYQRLFNKLPPVLVFSFAAMIAYYKNDGKFKIIDDEKNIVSLRNNDIKDILKDNSLWNISSDNQALCDEVEKVFNEITKNGITEEIQKLIKQDI